MAKRESATSPARSKRAEMYRYRYSEAPMRPGVGTQAEFRKKEPPATYHYDFSLSPALDRDGQDPVRERSKELNYASGR